MTKYIKCGGGGLPPQVITDMNTVLNKKFSTSTTYPSSEWADMIEEMTALPEESASGSIAHFTDGADTVPLKSCTLTLAPTQTGTGDPSPTNPRPITGVSSVDVVVCGANFMDASTLYSDFEQSDGSFFGLGSDFNSTYFYIPSELVGVEVTFSAYIKIPTGSTITNPRVSARVNGTNTNGNAVTSNDYSLSSVTFTPTSTSDRVRITYGSNGSQQVQFKNVMLEVGNTATDYAEYTQPTTTTLALGQTVYGGEVDVVGGEVETAMVGVTLNGSENWQSAGSGANTLFYLQGQDFYDGVVKNSASDISNIFVRAQVSTGNTNECFYIYQTGGNLARLNVRPNLTTYPDVASFKTLLSNTPLQVVFELATPTTAQITPAEINSRLGVNNVWHDGNGDTAVTYRADIDLYVNEHS